MYHISIPFNVYYDTNTKKWADYEDDGLLPVVPWALHIKQVSHTTTNLVTHFNQDSSKSDSGEWTTVKSKKKRR
jgi:hypothetical protein